VVAGGGAIGRREVVGHARTGCSILALAGTGRLADYLAAAVRSGPPLDDDELALVAASGRVTVCDVAAGPHAVSAAVVAAMAAAG
jgi:hypothetical protein